MTNSTGPRLEYEPNDPCGSGFRWTPGWSRFRRGMAREVWRRRMARGEVKACRHGVYVTGPSLDPGTRWVPWTGYCLPVQRGSDGRWGWPASKHEPRKVPR